MSEHDLEAILICSMVTPSRFEASSKLGMNGTTSESCGRTIEFSGYYR